MMFTTPRHLNGVAYGNGVFVAIGPATTILFSKDGKNWTNCSSEVRINCANINFTTETYSAGGDSITLVETTPLPKPSTFSEMETNPAALPNSAAGIPIDLLNLLELRSITFGRGTFVIVGDSGEILTSHDGEHWVTPASGTSDTLAGVVWGDRGFVAVGILGTILTSPDGLVWTQRTSGTDQTLLGVAYGNGTFVVLGTRNTVFISNDGIAWSPISITSDTMESIAFGNGIFMGTSIVKEIPDLPEEGELRGYDQNQTMVSTDGKEWHEVGNPFPPKVEQLYATAHMGHHGGTRALTFGGGLFIATSAAGIYTSKVGNNWNSSIEPKGFRASYYGAAYGNGLFVAVGDGSAIEPTFMGSFHSSGMTIATSKDANTWTFSRTPPSRLMRGLISPHPAQGKYFHAIGGFYPNIFLKATNIETWTTSTNPVNGNIYGNKVFFCGSNNVPVVLSSEDGIVWTRLKPRNSDQPTPVVASDMPNVIKSENGVVMELNGQAYKLNLTTAIGQPMEVQASTNLQSWVTLTTITNTGGVLNFVDPDAKNYPTRFYRLMLR